jgi:hypothetical protein
MITQEKEETENLQQHQSPEIEKINPNTKSNTNTSTNLHSILTEDTFIMDIEKDMIINKDKFTGTHVSSYEPNRIGNTFAYWYKDGEPRIIIGPHCKNYI